jgi:ketosteroid isomerase-like protein
MTPNTEVINRLYTAFASRDHVTMAECYAQDAVFSDPVFPELHGSEIGAMWHMLCEQGTDLVVTYSAVEADDQTGTAHWEPIYTFGPSGRTVHNIIDATFEFENGKIVRHRDHFDLWRWMRMALGTPGVVIGWTGAAKAKVRGQAARSLEGFIESHPEYQ